MSDTNAKHTPTPWKVIGLNHGWGEKGELIIGTDTDRIGNIHRWSEDGNWREVTCEIQQANAELIVKAVNSYQVMLDALKFAEDALVVNGASNDAIGVVEAAISLAEGKTK
jgi:hypothetical protein